MFFRKKKERLNTIKVTAAAPFLVRGDFTLKGHAPLEQAFLCGCEASQSKPFRDGRYSQVNFEN